MIKKVEEPGKNQQTSQETIINLACKSLAQGPFFGPSPSKYYPFFCPVPCGFFCAPAFKIIQLKG